MERRNRVTHDLESLRTLRRSRKGTCEEVECVVEHFVGVGRIVVVEYETRRVSAPRIIERSTRKY